MFKNEPLTDFSQANEREHLAAALSDLNARLKAGPLAVSSIIDGRPVHSGESFVRVDPSSSKAQIATVLFASPQMADGALQSVTKGFLSWSSTSIAERAGVVQRTAQKFRERRHFLSSLIIREAGKPWREADADVAEAIDFCEYYAEQMTLLSVPKRTAEVPGEDNYYFYQPRGVAVVISPWNFPLAIASGMTVAALVAGNVVVLKPSQQSSTIAQELVRALLESGLPANAIAFLPGRGEIIGRKLIDSKDVSLICFTGSKAVGLEIIAKAGQVQTGQSHVKRVIAEMGGKNAIIIDDDADLDEAVKGAIASCFGYSGQKCSACSRIIAVGGAYERFLERFCQAAAAVISGPAQDSATLLGPVIDAGSKARIDGVIAKASRECKLAFKGNALEGGFFVPIAIFMDVAPTNSIWREEIFGPVVACCQARDFDHALQLANDCEYALTGGCYSRSPAHIERVKREFKVGNLYINRPCTGALVCRQPFGGFRMSGIGSKAGGPDYLLQFLEPRVVTENTMRRGFAPENE